MGPQLDYPHALTPEHRECGLSQLHADPLTPPSRIDEHQAEVEYTGYHVAGPIIRSRPGPPRYPDNAPGVLGD